jgi:hypothetical protein
MRRARSAALFGLAALLALATARAQESPGKARLAIASDPIGATVLLVRSTDGGPVRFGTGDASEKLLGRTPVETDVPSGTAEVVVLKDGYVLKVEPVELKAGSSQRLEVRLAKDVPIPCAIAFKDARGEAKLAKTQAEAEQLVEKVLSEIVRGFVEERDPRALIDAATRTLVEALEAVRVARRSSGASSATTHAPASTRPRSTSAPTRRSRSRRRRSPRAASAGASPRARSPSRA